MASSFKYWKINSKTLSSDVQKIQYGDGLEKQAMFPKRKELHSMLGCFVFKYL